MPLTPKQKRVLDFVNNFTVKYGFAPSLNEIAKYLGKSITTAQHFIGKLEQKGFLHRKGNTARGLSSSQVGTRQIFKLGFIAAGAPIDPIENPEPIDVPFSFIIAPGNYYALEVKGDSMIDDNILDGDTIVVRQQQTANDGDTVVAITDKGATLKVFRNKNGIIFLEPRNKSLDIIYPKELEIRGRFCGLIRE